MMERRSLCVAGSSSSGVNVCELFITFVDHMSVISGHFVCCCKPVPLSDSVFVLGVYLNRAKACEYFVYHY